MKSSSPHYIVVKMHKVLHLVMLMLQIFSAKSCTHQDGQYNILEMIPQVGCISAEEDKVALDQLQKPEMTHSDIQSCLFSTVAVHSCYAERQIKWLEKLLTVFLPGFIPALGLSQKTADNSSEMRGYMKYREPDLMQNWTSLQSFQQR